ncbi:MAG: fumarylacetoacetate hydrolase family protein [Halieaceae bacterium]|jgi:2-keto-4-pentenoate hydratase/2-oxohepta-3-ene-1,7-dioic acid hydratase in catechol pathway|nr:fumarylacetoacetate hydrolase family protein [Halieaceae bacterium]
MRLYTFEVSTVFGNHQRLGAELPKNGKILDLNLAYSFMLSERDDHPCAAKLADVLVPPDILMLLQNGQFGLSAITEALDYFAGLGTGSDDARGRNGETLLYNMAEIQIMAPVPRPLSIRDTVGFLGHIRGAMAPNPIPPVYEEIPAIYYKGNVHSVVGPEVDVIWPEFGDSLDYELEVAAVIGRQGVNIEESDALDHVFGYTIFNDVSARTQQYKDMEGMLGPTKGKDFDTGNIMGPALVTADEFDPQASHEMTARVNGEEWSRGNLNQMDNGFAAIISYISRHETLYPGDIIGSGTVTTGCGAELRKFPVPGDTVELEVEGIGVLRNRFVKQS